MTRSHIAVYNADGSISAVQCHYYGEIDRTGAVLLNYHNSISLARKIIDGGNLIQVGQYSKNKRGIDKSLVSRYFNRYCSPMAFKDFQEYSNAIIEDYGQDIENFYLMPANKNCFPNHVAWWYSANGSLWHSLKSLLDGQLDKNLFWWLNE